MCWELKVKGVARHWEGVLGNQTCVLCESRESSQQTQLDTFSFITTRRGWHWYLVTKAKNIAKYLVARGQFPCTGNKKIT